MKKFVCKVCGYIYEGEAAPAECPVCHAKSNMFEEVKGELKLAAEHEYGVYGKTVKNNPDISDADKAYIFEQLKANFNGECSEVGMYLCMARIAHREGYPEIGLYWEKAAYEEAEHAAKFAEMLGEDLEPNMKATTKDNLKWRVDCEFGATAGKFELASCAKKNGLDIKVIEFQDYVSPNEALSHGDLDANIFQTLSYFELLNKQRNYGLAAVGKTITAPLTFYSKKWKSFSEIPTGARIAIPNDPSTEGRALYVLQEAGIIKLKPSAGRTGTPLDIISNPKKLKIVELDPAQTPRAIDDLDAAAVNGNYAYISGLSKTRKGILVEKPTANYINYIVVREKDKNADWVKTLVKAYQDPSVRAYINKSYKGNVIANF